MEIQIKFVQDDDGFLSQECPACRQRFKATFSGGGSAPLSFCPYCGHKGRDCWWTEAQAEYLGEVAAAKTIRPELERMAREINRKSGPLKMKMDPPGPPPRPPEELDEPWPIFTAPCCGEPIRYDGNYENLRCVICGRETPTSGNIRTGTIR